MGFTLASPAGKRVLKGTAMPRHLDVKRLRAPNANYGWVMTDGSGNGNLLAFKLDDIKEVNSHHKND